MGVERGWGGGLKKQRGQGNPSHCLCLLSRTVVHLAHCSTAALDKGRYLIVLRPC